MPTTVTLKPLPSVPAELSLAECVAMLYAFNDHAKELAKLFPRAVDLMSPDYDRVATLPVSLKGTVYTMKDEHVASYDDFCVGMSAALEFKDAFAAYAAAVQAATTGARSGRHFQQALDFYIADFRHELDRRVCRLWSYHPENVAPLGDVLRGWRVRR
jgi:hypothetical protein